MTNKIPDDTIGVKQSSQSLLKKLKPFDLSAAKRGEKIMSFFGEAMNFIGVRSDGNIVCEINEKYLITYDQKDLRMAPKTRTVWVNFWDFADIGVLHDSPMPAEWHESEEQANKFQRQNRIGGKAWKLEIEE